MTISWFATSRRRSRRWPGAASGPAIASRSFFRTARRWPSRSLRSRQPRRAPRLNPTYREQELEFYLRDLEAAAVIVADGDAGPAGAVAARLGIRVIECRMHEDRPAGCFDLVLSRHTHAGIAATGCHAG